MGSDTIDKRRADANSKDRRPVTEEGRARCKQVIESARTAEHLQRERDEAGIRTAVLVAEFCRDATKYNVRRPVGYLAYSWASDSGHNWKDESVQESAKRYVRHLRVIGETLLALPAGGAESRLLPSDRAVKPLLPFRNDPEALEAIVEDAVTIAGEADVLTEQHVRQAVEEHKARIGGTDNDRDDNSPLFNKTAAESFCHAVRQLSKTARTWTDVDTDQIRALLVQTETAVGRLLREQAR